MARRTAFLHIGLPRTGATFLAKALSSNEDRLWELGIHLPAPSLKEMFRAAVEVRRDHESWGLRRSQVEGTWAEICRRAHRTRSDIVLGHELLSPATPDEISLLLDGLSGFTVHVIVTARDPARQVTSGWEESVKSGRDESFGMFGERVLDSDRSHPQARRFWAAQHLGEVLDRWSAFVPPDRMHVVCCPPEGVEREVLWQRFGAAIGIDTATLVPPSARPAGMPLGTSEVAALRDVNRAIDGRITGPQHSDVVHRFFADDVLARTSSALPTIPPDMHDNLLALAEGWTKQIAGAGYVVHGSLEDLLPALPVSDAPHPDSVTPIDQLRTSTWALASVLVELAAMREQNQQLASRAASLKKKRKKLKRRLAAHQG